MRRAAEMRDQIEHTRIVDVAHHDGVELERAETLGLGRRDGRQCFADLAAVAGQLAVDDRIEAVQAQGDAIEPGFAQLTRLARQQDAVRGQCDVDDAGNALEPAHQQRQFAAQQRFAAGEADLAHPEAGEHARQPFNLLEREACVLVEKLMVVGILVFGQAIRAAEVAAIDDRDAQVRQSALPAICRRRFDQGERDARVHYTARKFGSASRGGCAALSAKRSPARAMR
jgi:hypothetical protein